MKLISLKIRGFKNLDFWDNAIDFTKSEGISIFVGNNGSGKSNVLEAISAIFYGLYDETNERRCDFSYELEYEKDGKNIFIKQDYQKGGNPLGSLSNDDLAILGILNEIRSVGYYINSIHVDNFDKKLLPSKIITLYSGEETRLYQLYYKNIFQDYINGVIRTNKIIEFPKMIFIDKDFWNIILLTMFTSVYSFDESDPLYIGLEKILGKGISIEEVYFDIDEDKLEIYKENEITNFVKVLSEINSISIENLIKFNQESGILGGREEFFKNLTIACNQKDLKNSLILNIYIKLNNGTNTNDLSEGQKKQILIYFVTNFFADKDSIILLDEPDSYIHVGNKQRLKDFFDEFLYITKEGEFIMTTHSPTLMHKFDKKHIFYLENGKLDDKEKAEILKEISGDSMSYTEQQIVLNTTKDIIIVEGKTDEIYIKTALGKLKEDNPQYQNLDFEFLLMGGSDHEILKRFSEQFPAKEGQKIMAFFDRDDAGLKCIKNALGEENIQKDTFTGKKLKDIYVNFYPKKAGFSQSNFEIEDYLKIEIIVEFMYKGNGIKVFGDTKSKLDKNSFANECKNFDKSEFENFRPLFDLIKSF